MSATWSLKGTMDDLISRKALLAAYDRVHIGEPGMARKLIEEAPTVDAVEVVHGRCDYCKDGKSFIRQTTMFGNDGLWHRINYCPNCGAKMDGDGNG